MKTLLGLILLISTPCFATAVYNPGMERSCYEGSPLLYSDICFGRVMSPAPQNLDTTPHQGPFIDPLYNFLWNPNLSFLYGGYQNYNPYMSTNIPLTMPTYFDPYSSGYYNDSIYGIMR